MTLTYAIEMSREQYQIFCHFDNHIILLDRHLVYSLVKLKKIRSQRNQKTVSNNKKNRKAIKTQHIKI